MVKWSKVRVRGHACARGRRNDALSGGVRGQGAALLRYRCGCCDTCALKCDSDACVCASGDASAWLRRMLSWWIAAALELMLVLELTLTCADTVVELHNVDRGRVAHACARWGKAEHGRVGVAR